MFMVEFFGTYWWVTSLVTVLQGDYPHRSSQLEKDVDLALPESLLAEQSV